MAGVIDIMRRRNVLAWLAIVNCVVFVAMAVAGIGVRLGVSGWLALPAWLELPGAAEAWLRRPWTLLTYMVTHREFLHLLFNMLWLLWFGSILLETLRPRHLLGAYLCGGLCGGLLYLAGGLWFPSLCPPGSVLIGASASVMAVMTLTAFRSPDYTFHLFFIGDVRLKWMAIAMIALGFLGLGGGNSGGEVAHIGGVLFGCVQGLLLRRGVDIFGISGHNQRRHAGVTASRRRRVVSVIEQHRIDAERLDSLLDKIRISGFNSLTSKERDELRRLSQKVTK